MAEPDVRFKLQTAKNFAFAEGEKPEAEESSRKFASSVWLRYRGRGINRLKQKQQFMTSCRVVGFVLQ
jgi:hypothetical protein